MLFFHVGIGSSRPAVGRKIAIKSRKGEFLFSTGLPVGECAHHCLACEKVLPPTHTRTKLEFGWIWWAKSPRWANFFRPPLTKNESPKDGRTWREMTRSTFAIIYAALFFSFVCCTLLPSNPGLVYSSTAGAAVFGALSKPRLILGPKEHIQKPVWKGGPLLRTLGFLSHTHGCCLAWMCIRWGSIRELGKYCAPPFSYSLFLCISLSLSVAGKFRASIVPVGVVWFDGVLYGCGMMPVASLWQLVYVAQGPAGRQAGGPLFGSVIAVYVLGSWSSSKAGVLNLSNYINAAWRNGKFYSVCVWESLFYRVVEQGGTW